MSFLKPTDGVVAGVIAAIVLLVLYVLRLRRRPVRVSHVMFWPAAAEDAQVNEPLRRLKPSWLLLLHAIILGLIAAAIGRPSITRGDSWSSETILVLDASASMAARDEPGGPTRLDRAKARARRLCDSILGSGGARLAVVSLAANAAIVSGFTSSRSAVYQAVDSIEQTDQPGDLLAALDVARAVSADQHAAGEELGGAAQVVLLSDGAFGGAGTPPTSSLKVRYERIGPTTQRPGAANIGITAMAAKRDEIDPATVRVFLSLLSTSRDQTSASITVTLDGRVMERRAVLLAGGRTDSPAPQSAVTFELRGAEQGVVQATLDAPDALESDNHAAIVLPAREAPVLVLVRPGSQTDKPDSAGLLLKDVLAELRPKEIREVAEADLRTALAAGTLRDASLFVLDRACPPETLTAPAIVFGCPRSFAGVGVSPEAERIDERDAIFWQRSHPVLRDLSLDSLVISESRRFSWAGPASESGAAFQPLVTGAQGSLAALVTAGTSRRIITAFDLAHSNWLLQASFPVFIAAAADYLILHADERIGASFKTSDPVTVATQPDAGPLALRGPVTISLPASTSAARVRTTSAVPRAGIYTVEGKGALSRVVAVNLTDVTESSLESPLQVHIGTRAVDTIAGGPTPLELWAWLVGVAIAALSIEWILYGLAVKA